MDRVGAFDIITLFRLMFLADMVVCLLLVGYGDGGRHQRELRRFVAARSLHGLACLVIGFAGGLSAFWGLHVPTVMVFFGFAIEGATIAVLRKDKLLGTILPFGLAAAGSLCLVAVAHSGPSRVGVASGVLGLLSVYVCCALVLTPGRTRLVWMMFAIFSANAMAQFLRAYGGFFERTNIDDQNWLQLAGLLTSYAYCIGGGVGFLLLLKEETDEELRRDAATDSLTGLLNHRAFFAAAQVRLDALEPEASLCLLFLDLDHFKRVNDTYGHPAGDAVLRQVGARLAAHLDGDCVIGRVGGEEFAMLFAAGVEAAREKAERVRQSMTTIRLAECPDHRCTASIGIATVQGRQEPINALVRRCDHALYEAKTSGRNRVVLAAAGNSDDPVDRKAAAA